MPKMNKQQTIERKQARDAKQQLSQYDAIYNERFLFWFAHFDCAIMADTNARIDAMNTAGN